MPSTFAQRVMVAAKAAVGIFSDNSLTQAYGLLRGVLPGGVGMPPQRGTVDFLRAYSQMPWLRAVTSRVGTATASAEWQLFVVRKKGERARRATRIQRAMSLKSRQLLMKEATEKDELEQIVDHPLLDLLHSANEFHTGFSARKITQLHIDLVGDAFWLKERDAGGMITAIWPIPPHWIAATPTPAFRFFRVNFRAWRGNIPDTEFVWFSDPDPMNPYARGSGAAMALGDELDTDEYASRMVKAFFYNSARPDLIISPKGGGNLRDASIKRLEEDWMAKNQGFFRSWKPYFLTREVDIKELDHNFRSLTLVQLREFERNVVMQQYGVPPEILGVLESSNRATIDAADYFMGKYVIEPRLEFQRAIMQERLVPEFDERLILDYVSPVAEDRERFLKVATEAAWSLTTNEWRAMSGHGPLEDEQAGELHMVPAGNSLQPIRETEVPDPDDEPEIEPPDAPPEPRETEPGQGRRSIDLDLLGSWRDEAAADVVVAKDAGDTELGAWIEKFIDDPGTLPGPSQIAARNESSLARGITRVWRDHGVRLSLVGIQAALERGSTEAVVETLDLRTLAAAQTQAIVPILVRTGLRGVDYAGRGLRAVGIPVKGLEPPTKDRKPPRIAVDLRGVNQEVTEWAEAHAAELLVASEQVREIVRLLVAEANEHGIAPRDLARMIADTVGLLPRQVAAIAALRAKLVGQGIDGEKLASRIDRYARAQQRSRAMTIARTETIAAVNAGQQALWDSARRSGAIRDDEFERVWLVTDDDALDLQICEPLTDARAALDEPFEGGYMHPPAHPRCRCAVGLVEKDKPKRAKKKKATK